MILLVIGIDPDIGKVGMISVTVVDGDSTIDPLECIASAIVDDTSTVKGRGFFDFVIRESFTLEKSTRWRGGSDRDRITE